ncbi:ATP-binding cassette domain-containing protein [Scytonema sp. NUACC26]|uniref:ATP-binding cassette domain-containing protein n=1 Tax=Scytonema sp. NUACC26 TaxID=3140176 RepID=UPI0034DCB4BF
MEYSFLNVEDIGKEFHRTQVISNVSFSLKRGESMVIQGPSGCGKTTLLRCIALLEEVNQGKIIFNGETVSKPGFVKRDFGKHRLQIGMVFQQLYLWSHMTILENVSLPLWLRNGKKNKKIADEVAKEKLALLGIKHKANDYPNQLSGGQRQRAALARALVHSPQLLLLDEITANLDSETTDKVIAIVEEISRNTSVILITHSNLSLANWSYVLFFDGIQWKFQKT